MYKKIFLSLVAAAIFSFNSFGQAPENFNYQAVVRNAGNTILNNQAVGLRMTIQQGSIGGTTVYSETFSPTTNAYGLVNLQIGNGTVVIGTFANIDWSAGPYFMETAVDVTGGTNYSVMGTSQLMSVPYALYAKTSGNGQGPAGPQGIQGPAGVDGINGTNGIDGAIGATGPAGPQGTTGAQGIQGLPGTNGSVGATGPAGATGLVGPQGVTGPAGPAGAQGIQGLPGTNGTVGATGPAGPSGAQGNQGPAGVSGTSGTNGQGGVTTAGADIAIAGTGTVADPYIVSSRIYTIGLWPELGGYVFRISADGRHGLVAETQDQSAASSWYLAQDAISNPLNHSINGQKFMDWRLPTKYELNEMYLQKGAIGGFANYYYWSSTEYDNVNAWLQDIYNGFQVNVDKVNVDVDVHSVRAF